MSSGQMRLRHPVGEMAAIVHVPHGSKTRVRNGSETAPTDCCLQAASPSSASLVAGNPAKPALGNRRAGKQIFATFDLRISESALFCVVSH